MQVCSISCPLPGLLTESSWCHRHTATANHQHVQTATDATLQKLATTLSSSEPPVPFHLWIEQPENVPTCLALAPNRARDGSERSKKVKKALDKCGCRLWKG